MSAGLNLYRRFLALFPAPALDYGRVVSSAGDTVTVALFQGGLLTVPSTVPLAADSWVWIIREQGVWRLTPAPAFVVTTIEV